MSDETSANIQMTNESINDVQMTEETPISFIQTKTPTSANPKKRKVSEIEKEKSDDNNVNLSIQDVLNRISDSDKLHSDGFAALRNDIALWRQETSRQIEAIQGKVSKVENSIENIKERMNGHDKNIEDLSETSNNHGIEINRILQEKLECQMIIAGINHEIIEKTENMLELAMNTIAAQGIIVERNDIVRVSKRIFNVTGKDQKEYKKGILNVVFKEFDKKIEVMKKKRQNYKKGDKIFFNIALTPHNRQFMHQAKDITKGKLKVYFGRGCVRVIKEDKSEMVIDDLNKIEELKKYMSNIKSNK